MDKTPDYKSPLLYFVGCTPAYDPRSQEIAKSLVTIFNSAKVNFGILGNKERCCGDAILRLGEKGLFQELAETNIKNIQDLGSPPVVTTSPHCYNTFKKDYPPFGGNFTVLHYTHVLSDLISKQELRFSKEINKTVTFHDPCFLGRYNNIFEEPRSILESIPGLKVIEMGRNREDSFCCGGGGGRMWLGETKGDRPCVIRAREAAQLGVDILVVSCPFCLLMLEDGVKVIEKDRELDVKDLAELVKIAL